MKLIHKYPDVNLVIDLRNAIIIGDRDSGGVYLRAELQEVLRRHGWVETQFSAHFIADLPGPQLAHLYMDMQILARSLNI